MKYPNFYKFLLQKIINFTKLSNMFLKYSCRNALVSKTFHIFYMFWGYWKFLIFKFCEKIIKIIKFGIIQNCCIFLNLIKFKTIANFIFIRKYCQFHERSQIWFFFFSNLEILLNLEILSNSEVMLTYVKFENCFVCENFNFFFIYTFLVKSLE